MALYCYIVETGYYEDRQANILGHKNKYSHKEFDNICIEITKKYGDVEEVGYFSNYDLTDVEEIKYNIDAHELIKYLVSDYGFIELNVPVNDGYNVKEISRKPVPRENLVKVEFQPEKQCPSTPPVENEITCILPDFDFDGLTNIEHVNARCFTGKLIPVFKKSEDIKEDNRAIKMTKKGDYCDIECIYYYIDYETRYDSEGCPYDENISRCKLGHFAIEDASFCKYYVERAY